MARKNNKHSVWVEADNGDAIAMFVYYSELEAVDGFYDTIDLIESLKAFDYIKESARITVHLDSPTMKDVDVADM